VLLINPEENHLCESPVTLACLVVNPLKALARKLKSQNSDPGTQPMQEKELRSTNPATQYHPLPPSTYPDATKYIVQKDFCFQLVMEGRIMIEN
jgi:hypothetical protein